MKHLKTLGLVATTATALLAFAGAGTATAESTLCKATETPCSAGNALGVGTEINTQLVPGTQAVLTPSGFFSEEVTCGDSQISGKVETATTPSGKMTMSFQECSHKVVVMNSGSLRAHWDSEHNASVTAIGIEVTVEQSGISCLFGGEVKENLTLTGGSPAKADGPADLPGISGFPCPKSAEWHAEYEALTPKSIYLSKGV